MSMSPGPHAESEAEVVGQHKHGDVLGGRRLSLTVVTPQGAKAARLVDEVTAPGARGEFGVLPGHIPFLTALKSGVLVLRDGPHKDVLAVGPGFVQVGAGDRVQILVGRALASAEIDLDEAKADLHKATDEMKKGGADEAGFALLQDRLAWAHARLDALGGHGKKD
jgi:F-type H+-transporting ATPase subunit epsilon